MIHLVLPSLLAFAAGTPPPSTQLLRNAGGANDAYAAVGRFRGGSTCTGSFIDPSDTGAPDAKAWLLTAGHCVSLDAYGVIRNQPLTGTVEFNYFVDTQNSRVPVRARATGWSTMKGTDLALVELDARLGDLRARGIRPLRLAARPTATGREVFWTGIPGSPIPGEQQFLRLGQCTLGETVSLLERRWIWSGELSNDCPDLYGGASGSPVFDAQSREIIGVIGTSTVLSLTGGPDYDCQLNRPCVSLAGGPIVQRDTSYAASVHGIAACFDAANELNPLRPGCPLDPGYQLKVDTGLNDDARPEVDGKPATWDARLSGEQRYYAYKHFPMGQGDCAELEGYSRPIAVASSSVISDRVGKGDGYYYLCVLAGDSPSFDATWQQPRHASMRFKHLDSQPPAIIADYAITERLNGYRLESLDAGTPSDLGVIEYKRGPLPATDCDDSSGYRFLVSIPQTILTSEFPVRICWRLSDKAGNTAAPIAFDFGPPTIQPGGVRNSASFERGVIAPGSMVRIDTFNLTHTTEYSVSPVEKLAGVRAWLTDSAGRTSPFLMTVAGPLYLEGLAPAVVPGPATIRVQPPEGPLLTQSVKVSAPAPGLFSADFSGAGAPLGFALNNNLSVFPLAACSNPYQCSVPILPLSSSKGGLDFVLYVTGLRESPEQARVQIGTFRLDAARIFPSGDFPGLDEAHFHLPQDFPLRLYQLISVEAPGAPSNYLWVRLE